MNNLFENSILFSEPYDHIICDNFLKNYDLYDEHYPIEILHKPIRMDADLTFGDPNYEKIFHTQYKVLHDYVYGGSFVADMLKIFKPSLTRRLETGELLNDPLSMEIRKQPYELRNFISRSNNINNDIFLFPRMDFGVGYAGYGIENGGRGIHTDNITRLISIMLFFSNQEELCDGEHQMHKIHKNDNYRNETVKTVPIKKNRLLASVQSNDAFHSVKPLKGGTRKAIYLSVSSSAKIWKEYDDENLRFISKNRS